MTNEERRRATAPVQSAEMVIEPGMTYVICYECGAMVVYAQRALHKTWHTTLELKKAT